MYAMCSVYAIYRAYCVYWKYALCGHALNTSLGTYLEEDGFVINGKTTNIKNALHANRSDLTPNAKNRNIFEYQLVYVPTYYIIRPRFIFLQPIF